MDGQFELVIPTYITYILKEKCAGKQAELKLIVDGFLKDKSAFWQ